LEQVTASHSQRPFVVSQRPFEQVPHVPLPHVLADWDAQSTQVLPLQHPFEQELVVHSQAPASVQI
jgi:hypothetical protein